MESNTQEKVLVNPTVLIMEDDESELYDIAQNFTLHTTLGVLPVQNMDEGAEYLHKKRFHICSVVADQKFEPEFRSKSRRLTSGLDFLELTGKERPDLARYLNSVDGTDSALLKRAARVIGHPGRVFGKGQKREPGQQIWACVEKDYLTQALRKDRLVQDAANREHINLLAAQQGLLAGEDDVADRLRRLFDAHRVTFMRKMGPAGQTLGFRFNRPIEVVCVKLPNGYSARALGLGVLEEGEGRDAWEAMLDLSDRIAETYALFRTTPLSDLDKFTAKVLTNLESVIDIADEA